MATFNVTTQIFTYLDTVVSTIVSSNIANVIGFVSPMIALGLTMALMIEGVFMLAHPAGNPLSELVTRFIKYAFIISIASTGGWYQTTLANAALKVPDEFASVFVINSSSSSSASTSIASTIDQGIDYGLTTAKTAFENASVFSGPGIASAILGVGAIIGTVIMAGMGAGLVLMAKVMLAITVCLGPLFIYLLLFKSTASFFTKWMGMVINYGFVSVLVSAVFGLLISFYNNAIEAAATTNSSVTILVSIASCLLILILSIYVMKEVPHLATALGIGVAADIFRHLPRLPAPKKDPPRNADKGGGNGGSGNAASSNSAGSHRGAANPGSGDRAGSRGNTSGGSSQTNGLAKGSRGSGGS